MLQLHCGEERTIGKEDGVITKLINKRFKNIRTISC